MDLDEAIQHCEEVADEKEEDAILYHNCATYNQLAENTEKECRACAEEHRQLAEWLKELKAYREQSGDAISRDEVLYLIADCDLSMGQVVKAIHALPCVTPQQKTGHWIIIDDCEQFIAKCSECGRIEDSRMISKYPYCHCGAKMEVEE